MRRRMTARGWASVIRRRFAEDGAAGAAAADEICNVIERRYGRNALEHVLVEFELLIEAERDAGVRVELTRLN